MVSIIEPIYRDENATELNKRLEKVLDNLQIEEEAITDRLMDLTLDNEERREKTFTEMSKNPEQCHIMVDLMNQKEKVSSFALELRDILYSGYKETPLNEEKEHRMNEEEMSEWLGDKVKPFILKGVTKQSTIAAELDVPSPTICYRIKAVYGKTMSWDKYKENVKKGTY